MFLCVDPFHVFSRLLGLIGDTQRRDRVSRGHDGFWALRTTAGAQSPVRGTILFRSRHHFLQGRDDTDERRGRSTAFSIGPGCSPSSALVLKVLHHL